MRIVPLFANNPGAWTGAGNHTYLLADADAAMLVDAGVGEPAHLDALARALDELSAESRARGGPGVRFERVLATHAHEDHASGAPAIAAAHAGVRFAKFPWPGRDEKYPVTWERLADGDVVTVGTQQLVALHTPGHAPDHLCFFHEPSGDLFGGDLVVKGSTVAILASHGGNLAQYLASLRRVLEIGPRRILSAHGDAVDEPATLLRSYLAHRAMRERQIFDLLDGTPQAVADLVARLYADLAPGLHGAASESVLAHLQKLRDEDRVLEETDAGGVTRWTAR